MNLEDFREAMENMALYGTPTRPRLPDVHEIVATWPCGHREKARCDIEAGATTVFRLEPPERCPTCGREGKPRVDQHFISGGPR